MFCPPTNICLLLPIDWPSNIWNCLFRQPSAGYFHLEGAALCNIFADGALTVLTCIYDLVLGSSALFFFSR